jgi:hypothetical protein
MNNKILVGIGSILIIIGLFFFFNNSGSEIKNPLQENNQFSEKTSKPKITKNLEFTENKSLFKDNFVNKKTKNIKNETKIDEKNYQKNSNVNNQITNNDKSLNNFKNNEFVFDEKGFNNFVYENNLEEVENIDNHVKIYTKNLPVKNDFAPPMPPVLIKVKFKEKTKIIPVNSNLITSNKKIYIVNENNNEKKVEVKKIDTKDIFSFTPPMIGQN